jgi:bifunctional non-homologous end joining protein LigD
MMAVPGALPTGPDWGYEAGWPGERTLVAVDGGRLSFSNGQRYPVLRDLGLQLGSRQVLLDVVVLSAPTQLVITDLLHLEGRALLELTYDDRRAALEGLALHGPTWQVSEVFDEGEVLLAAVRAQGLPGVLAKRRSSPYRPGQSTGDWVAVS